MTATLALVELPWLFSSISCHSFAVRAGLGAVFNSVDNHLCKDGIHRFLLAGQEPKGSWPVHARYFLSRVFSPSSPRLAACPLGSYCWDLLLTQMTNPIASAIRTNTTIASELMKSLPLSVARVRVKIAQRKQTATWYLLIGDSKSTAEIVYADGGGGARSLGSERLVKGSHRAATRDCSRQTAGSSRAREGGSAPNDNCRRGALLWSRICFWRDVTADSIGDEFAK